MITSNLGLGPMSPEIIEAVFRYSQTNKLELMLIASKNQIDYSGGYVGGWDTKEYMKFIKKMKIEYPSSKILVCRDHCGPGFNGNYDLEDTYSTIKSDIENGFDLIHIDFCNFKGSKEEMMDESKKAVEYCLKLNSNIMLEIGTDENLGDMYNEDKIIEIEEEIRFFKEFCTPTFYVVQTGSLIKEINQRGTFNKEFVQKISKVLKNYGLKLKEHNADYLSKSEIVERKGIVDALNIAPQLGVLQTTLTINECLKYGIRIDSFLDVSYQGRKWKKWLDTNNENNKFLCSIIAGHYHFASKEYQDILQNLYRQSDAKENIIKNIMKNIRHYENY